MKTTNLFLVTLFTAAAFLQAAESSLSLPAPRMSGGKPVMQALKERQSTRDYKTDSLNKQQMSDLLWAAFGINRPENDHRTAPSAQNLQDVDIYVAVADGYYLFDAKSHSLKKLSDQDVRPLTSGQPFGKIAPVQLIYVSDYARLAKVPPQLRDLYAGVDTGAIVQNVYLFCASENLATVVHELNREPLAKAMNLRPDQRIVVAQAVGFPK